MANAEHGSNSVQPAPIPTNRHDHASGAQESGVASDRDGSLLDLQELAGNRAVADLLTAGAAGGEAGDEAGGAAGGSTGQAGGPSGTIHPALQRASAALRQRTGLFGGPHSAYGANPPQFASEPADRLLLAGRPTPAKHSEFPAVMGQTAYERDKVERWPSFSVIYHTPWNHWFSKTAVPNKTAAVGATWWAIATPANEEGYRMEGGRAEYPGYDYYIRVSAKAAAMIADAEQQHINDLDQGWAITGDGTATAINAVADEDPDVKPDEYNAKNAAADRVAAKMGGVGEKIKGSLRSGGRLEEALAPLMMGAYEASKKTRDASGQHTVPIKFKEKDETKKRVVYEVDDGFTLQAPASASVVNEGTIG